MLRAVLHSLDHVILAVRELETATRDSRCCGGVGRPTPEAAACPRRRRVRERGGNREARHERHGGGGNAPEMVEGAASVAQSASTWSGDAGRSRSGRGGFAAL
jgi:hypothetical protein